jgi:phage N-6-adenine-methyltransferase
MDNLKPLMKNEKNDWETPDELFDDLDKIYKFDFDLACTEFNCKTERGIHFPEFNSLGVDWHGLDGQWLWLNPPYDDLKTWIHKCHHEAQEGAKIIALITARPDTKIWQEIIFPHYEFKFLKGRLKFKGAKDPAPFPSALVKFQKDDGFRRL